jgi:VanZ family protein
MNTILTSPRVRTAYRVLVAVYVVALFASTHLPLPAIVEELPASDKDLHLAAYAVLALLVGFWRGTATLATPGRLAGVSAGLLIYAAFDEVLQGPVGRSPDVRDWLADAAGIIIGLCAALVLRRQWTARFAPTGSFAQ